MLTQLFSNLINLGFDVKQISGNSFWKDTSLLSFLFFFKKNVSALRSCRGLPGIYLKTWANKIETICMAQYHCRWLKKQHDCF